MDYLDNTWFRYQIDCALESQDFYTKEMSKVTKVSLTLFFPIRLQFSFVHFEMPRRFAGNHQ